jgi:Fe-S-cluster containining protein
MTTRRTYHCERCPGYCCSHPRIAVTDHDLDRLAAHLGITRAVARRRYTYRYRTADVDEQVLRHRRDHVYRSVCRFFDQRERCCTIYAARPYVCRRYPYGNHCGYYSFLRFERRHQGDDEFIPDF